MTNSFRRIRREGNINSLIIDLLPKIEPEEGTDINSRSSELSEWNSTSGHVV
jgi:hypothetical protein